MLGVADRGEGRGRSKSRDAAKEKAAGENHSRPELMKGAYLRDVYRKYGVL